MITAIIIDDEPKGRLALRQKLKDYCPDVTVTGEAGDGEEGLRLIEQLQPAIVFLDIENGRYESFCRFNVTLWTSTVLVHTVGDGSVALPCLVA